MSGPLGQPGLPDGSSGNKDAGDDVTQDEASGAPGSLTALFRVGADEDLTVGLSPATASLPRLLSQGAEVQYAVNGSTLLGFVALAGGGVREVFALTVNADGSWSFDLRDQLDHVAGGGENLLLRTVDGEPVAGIDFSGVLLGIDADGDGVSAAPGAFVIRVQDDVPVFAGSSIAVLSNAAGDTFGDLSFSVGSDEPAGPVRFAHETGTTNLTINGRPVLYMTGDDGTTATGYVDTNNDGVVGSSEKVFKVTLIGNTGYQVMLFKPVDIGASIDVNGSSFGAGPRDYQILTSGANGAGQQLAVLTAQAVTPAFVLADWYSTAAWNGSGVAPGKVNGTAAGWGIGNGNMDPGEMMRVDFNDDRFAGTSFDGPAVSGATFSFSQGKAGDEVRYVVYLENGDKEIGSVSPVAGPFTIHAPEGTAIDYIEFLDRSGSVKLDLVSVTTAGTRNASSFELDLVMTDSDGDAALGSLSVVISPGAPIKGTEGADNLTGTSAADVIDGGSGNDWLAGGAGDDILIGNLGSDTMVGGPGADTFKLADLSASDLIADYEAGDRIDLTALFSTGIEGPSTPQQLTEFVHYENGVLSVDADGAGSAHALTQVAFVDTAGAGTAPPPTIQIVYDDQSHHVHTANVTG